MIRSDAVKLFNKAHFKNRRQLLRKNPTDPEKTFWQVVRDQQLGVKFRRQHGIGHYIADFYCAEHQLVIELDGGSHFTDEGQQYDLVRDAFFRANGLRVLRFTNQQIIQELDSVVVAVGMALQLPVSELTPP
jgi:very-short-patch-repair endonuclease